MVSCIIEIVEVPGGGVRVDMKPDQANGTPKERGIAGALDHLLRPVLQGLVEATGRGERIESKETVEAMRLILEERAQRFFSS
jgi:hypothetical protein